MTQTSRNKPSHEILAMKAQGSLGKWAQARESPCCLLTQTIDIMSLETRPKFRRLARVLSTGYVSIGYFKEDFEHFVQ